MKSLTQKPAIFTSLLVLAFAGIGLPSPAEAVPTVFTDRTAWEAGRNVATENFDAFVPFTQIPDGTSPLGQIQTTTFGVPFFQPFFNAAFTASPIMSGTTVFDFVSNVPGEEKSAVTYTLPIPVTAFGFDIFWDSTVPLELDILFGSESIRLASFVPDSGESFVGIATTAPTFDSIVFRLNDSRTLQTSNLVWELDNFSFQTPQQDKPVPEPGAVALFAVGLLGVGALRRRSTRRNELQ